MRTLVICYLLLVGCASVEQKTGAVLDNANSAIKATPEDKLWGSEPEAEGKRRARY